MSQSSTNRPGPQGLSYSQQKHGMRLVILASSTGSMIWVYVTLSAIFALMIKAMGGSDFAAMLPGSLSLMFRIVQPFVALHVPPKYGHRFMVAMLNVSVATMFLGTLVPFLPLEKEPKMWLFMGGFLLGLFFDAVGGTFWFPMLHDIVPTELRGRFFGRLRSVWNGLGLIIVLLSGWFLGSSPAIWQYQVVLMVGVLLAFVRNLVLLRMPIGNSLSGDFDFDDWTHYIKGLFRQKTLLFFIVYYTSLGFCMGFLGQPLILYMKSRGLASNDNIFVYGSTTLGMILTFIIAGAMVDRFGTKKIFLTAHLVLFAVCIYVFFIGFTTMERFMMLMPVALVLAGSMVGASDIACTAQLFHLVPNRGRAFYMSLSFVVIWFGQAMSPLLMGGLASYFGTGELMSVGGWKVNIYQISILLSGLALLLIISLLMLVKNVQPKNEKV